MTHSSSRRLYAAALEQPADKIHMTKPKMPTAHAVGISFALLLFFVVSVILGVKYKNVWIVAVKLLVIETISYQELIRNRKADIVDRNFHLAVIGLVQ